MNIKKFEEFSSDSLNERKDFLPKNAEHLFVYMASRNQLHYQIPAIFPQGTEALDPGVKAKINSDQEVEYKVEAVVRKANDEIISIIMDAEKKIAKVGEDAAKQVNAFAK